SIKVNGVTDDALRLYLFPHSLTHHATAWFNRLPRNSINTFEKMAKMFLEKYLPPSMVTKLRNEIINFCQRPDKSLFEAWERYKISIDRCPNHNMFPVTQIDTFYNGLTLRHRDTINAAAGGTFIKRPIVHMMQDPIKANDAILKNMQTNMNFLTNSNLELKNMFGQFTKMNTTSSLGSGTLPGNTITIPKEDLKGIITRSGTAYPGPTIPTTSSSQLVERKTEATKDTMHPTNNRSTEDVQPLIVPTESLILNSEPVISPIIEPVASPFNAPKPNQTPLIPYPSRLQDQKLLLLKRLLDKLRDPGKFLILYDFPGMAECLALVDLGASINLMPFSMWNKLSLPDLSPTCMTLELSNSLISPSVGVAKDVFVKVGTFHFPTDFVVVDFDDDPRVPLILRRSFLKTGRALIDVFEGELTLRVGKEAITFNLDQTFNNRKLTLIWWSWLIKVNGI
nr:reverse transcriptase domain-containing protein [Tanacetum cinerariifolium]